MITLKRPASVDACRNLPVVRSGPVSPPVAFIPWQREQCLSKIPSPARTSTNASYGLASSCAERLFVAPPEIVNAAPALEKPVSDLP